MCELLLLYTILNLRLQYKNVAGSKEFTLMILVANMPLSINLISKRTSHFNIQQIEIGVDS